MFRTTIDVADDQRVLVYRRNRLEQVLRAGRHQFWQWRDRRVFKPHQIANLLFEQVNVKTLMQLSGQVLENDTELFEMADHEVGLMYRDEHLFQVLKPGSVTAIWRDVAQVRVEVVNLKNQLRVSEDLLNQLTKGGQVQNTGMLYGFSYHKVPEFHLGLLEVDGQLVDTLAPGQYGFWQHRHQVSVRLVDLKVLPLEVSGQEILTKDRVSLRLNILANYQIIEPNTLVAKVNDVNAHLYKELQLALRAAVGTRTLDELLADKDALNQIVFASVTEQLQGFGVKILSVGIKDIILPGEMKTILNQVVEAQKSAEANLIRRREETQAMRSLHNTAKMMENNPIVLRLKELEALERVTERVDKLTVYGGLQGVMNDLVKLTPDN